ncbi:MAG: ParB N-terminal domain-containing protein, partial [Acidobacteria bacterium]|nr:ParB N-terminal domain-containing protein [Acidobacteriota bacterium]
KHYTPKHLEEVKAIMARRGAPVIRAIWNECHGVWMAIEGCHRIRAAQELGLTPIIKDISRQKRVRMQVDGENVRVSVRRLAEELQDEAPRAELITFRP